MREPAPRPRLHLSTPQGWINDPHGVIWHDGRYHVFFQYVPGAAAWAPQCSWGHMTGPDLVTWDAEVDLALTPDDDEDGCWTGALVLDERPTILYTSTVADDPDGSRIVLAVGDEHLRRWTKLAPAVLEAPAGVTEFRDPSVARDGDGWRMVVGGRQEGAAVALLFRSPDLRNWSAAGTLCRQAPGPDDPVPTGDAWECVQLLEIDGAWVLIASAWTHSVDDGVVHAVGTFDGTTFTPRSWQRFDHGGALYATTTFRDADGRWCALSWVREAEPAHPGRLRAGALSLAHRLAVDDDRLMIAPHPDLHRLRGDALPLDGALPRQCELETVVSDRVVIGGLELARDGADLLLCVGTEHVRRMTVPAGASVRIVLDEDIAEVFVDGLLAVLRVPDRTDMLTGADARTQLWPLRVPINGVAAPASASTAPSVSAPPS